MILESHRSSFDVIHCIILLVDSLRRVINLYVMFLMTAGQLGTLLAVNIPLALQYIGKPCSILNALLYATYDRSLNVFPTVTELAHDIGEFCSRRGVIFFHPFCPDSVPVSGFNPSGNPPLHDLWQKKVCFSFLVRAIFSYYTDYGNFTG